MRRDGRSGETGETRKDERKQLAGGNGQPAATGRRSELGGQTADDKISNFELPIANLGCEEA
jgi:hypothetical protein